MGRDKVDLTELVERSVLLFGAVVARILPNDRLLVLTSVNRQPHCVFALLFDVFFETQTIFDFSILPVVRNEFVSVLFVKSDRFWLFFTSF